MYWNSTNPFGTDDAVGAVDYFYTSFYQSASYSLLLHDADHCYESSRACLNIYCLETVTDVAEEENIHDTASLLRHSRRIVAFLCMQYRNEDTLVVEAVDVEHQILIESRPDSVAFVVAASVVVPPRAGNTLHVASAGDDSMRIVVADTASSQTRDGVDTFAAMKGVLNWAAGR